MAPAPFVPPPDFSPKTDSAYHYIPTAWVCLVFVCLFSVTTFLHAVEALKFKLWWFLPTAVLAGFGEIIGWSARYWSSQNDGTLATPFLMQISTTIIAPTPFLAAYFIILRRLIVQLGPEYSRISARLYSKIFLTADLVALVVQAAGGGLASSSKDPNFGGNIMLVGIAIQLFFLLIFIGLATDFFRRLWNDAPLRQASEPFADTTMPMKHMGAIPLASSSTLGVHTNLRASASLRWFVIGMGISIVCLLIRAIYRLIELSSGWNGPVISTQWLFNVFDGTMVFIAMTTLNAFHPGVMLGW